MATKRFRELKELSEEELTTKIRESESQLFEIRMKKEIGQLTDTASLWRLRKDIARMKMLQSQKSSDAGERAAR